MGLDNGVQCHLQSQNAIGNDVHDDGLGEDLHFLRGYRLLHERRAGNRSRIRLGSQAGRTLLARVRREQLILFSVFRRAWGRSCRVSSVVVVVEESLLLGTSYAITSSDSRKPARQSVAQLSATILLRLLLCVSLVQEEESDYNPNEYRCCAEKVREQVGEFIPNCSSSEDIGVADARSG